MRHYETLFIVNPDLSDEDHAQTVERYQDILTSQGANLLLTDDWGRRRLAYEINGFAKGRYILFEYTSRPPAITEMERNMRLDEKVLRFLTIKKAEEFDEEAFKARLAKAASSRGSKADEAEAGGVEAEGLQEEAETLAPDWREDEDREETAPESAESEGEAFEDEAEGDEEKDPASGPASETEL